MALAGASDVGLALEALLGLGDRDALELELEAGELDLQLGLRRTGAAGEDLEDDLRAVEDPHAQRLAEVEGLDGVEVVVDDHRVGFAVGGDGAKLLDLPGADHRAAVGFDPVLHQLARDLEAGGLGEPTELQQGVGDLQGVLPEADDLNEDGAFDMARVV